MLLRDNIYQAIRHSILTCEYRPGEDLREQVLAERYGVSRSPVRDSLLRLEQEKLITVLPRQGYRVNPISKADVEEIFGLRLLLEPACAAAAARADDEALKTLDRFREFVPGDQGKFDFIEYNRSFHGAITELSGNPRMSALSLELEQQFQRLMVVSLSTSNYEPILEALREHVSIIDAIQAHDGDRAAQLSLEHSQHGHDRIARAMAGPGHRSAEKSEEISAPIDTSVG